MTMAMNSHNRIGKPVYSWNSKAAIEDLPGRPKKIEGESELGYLLRRADGNGVAFPRWIMLDNGGVSFAVSRCCPTCLAGKAPYWPASWEDLTLPYCSEHEQWLIDTCHGCERQLKPARLRLRECGCGHLLSNNPVTRPHPRTLRMLESDEAPFGLLMMLGAVDRNGLQGKPLKVASSQAMTEVADLLDRGAYVVADWPSKFIELLNRQRIWPPAKGSVQLLNAALPGLGTTLRRVKDAVWRERLHEAVRLYVHSHLESDYPLVSRNKNLAGIGRKQREVATALGISFQGFRRLVDAGALQSDIATRITLAGRARQIVRLEQIAEVQTFVAGRVSRKQVAGLLALEPRRLTKLREAGYLEETDEWWSVVAAERFIAAILNKASGSAPPVGEAVSVGRAFRFWVPVEHTAAFFQAVLEQRLSLYVPSPSVACKVGTLLTVAAEVMAWIQAKLMVRGDVYTVHAAARALGIKSEVAYQLTSSGLLSSERVRLGRRICTVVFLDGLAKFLTEYEALAPLARAAGVAPKHGYHWALEQGLEVATGPIVDGSRQYFVKRRRCEKRRRSRN